TRCCICSDASSVFLSSSLALATSISPSFPLSSAANKSRHTVVPGARNAVPVLSVSFSVMLVELLYPRPTPVLKYAGSSFRSVRSIYGLRQQVLVQLLSRQQWLAAWRGAEGGLVVNEYTSVG